jgi:hypothetical protein
MQRARTVYVESVHHRARCIPRFGAPFFADAMNEGWPEEESA